MVSELLLLMYCVSAVPRLLSSQKNLAVHLSTRRLALEHSQYILDPLLDLSSSLHRPLTSWDCSAIPNPRRILTTLAELASETTTDQSRR